MGYDVHDNRFGHVASRIQSVWTSVISHNEFYLDLAVEIIGHLRVQGDVGSVLDHHVDLICIGSDRFSSIRQQVRRIVIVPEILCEVDGICLYVILVHLEYIWKGFDQFWRRIVLNVKIP